MEYSYTPRMVCSTRIRFSIDDGIIHDVRFDNGCDGNLKAIAKLVEGKDAKEIADILEGNDCHGRGTSCADQFSKAIRKALEAQ